MSLTDTILIVDDSSFIVEGLVAILKKSYRPIAVYSGQQCLDILQKEMPSIIILDIMMEPMDGWETLARIKENPATRHIPVLMFSAKKISSSEAEEHRISIDDFVSKPVTPKKLIESIEKVLARQRTNRANIESWRSAGIDQDRIDEYTSLVTSQEVDMSLLQNMKVQLSLLRDDDDKTRSDLESVIAAIESRIQDEHVQEEKLSCELQDLVAKDVKEKECAGPVLVKDTCNDAGSPAGNGEVTQTRDEPLDFVNADGQTILSATEISVVEVNVVPEITEPVISEIPHSDADTIPEIPCAGSDSEGRPLQETPWKEPAITAPVESPDVKSDSGSLLSGSSFPKIFPEKHPATPVPTEPSTECSLSGVQVSPADEVLPAREQKKSPVNQDSPLPAMNLNNTPVAPNAPCSVSGVQLSPAEEALPAGEQKKSPVNQDSPLPALNLSNKPVGSHAPAGSAIGSGTDTSSRRSSPGRSPNRSEAATKHQEVPVKDAPPSTGGFISRIISMIVGIFKRPGK